MGRPLMHERTTNAVIDGRRFHGNTKHRGTTDAALRPLYVRWTLMINRCENPRNKRFARYGGRGIRICERWRNDFSLFVADMGLPPTPGHTLERIDNDGNYEPGNVRWATVREQNRNTGSNRLITAHGETLCVAEWAERLGCSESTLRDRLSRGWSLERAVSEPPSLSHRERRLGKHERSVA